jgi:hypothetical protein
MSHAKCNEPECDQCGETEGGLYLHAKCHMSSPTWAILDGEKLTITCAECGKEVARFWIQMKTN